MQHGKELATANPDADNELRQRKTFNDKNNPTSNESSDSDRGEIHACKSGSKGAACYWRGFSDPKKCSPDKPCSKLAVYFSGGEMSCDNLDAFASKSVKDMLLKYAAAGYVSVCAGIFLDSDSSATMPFRAESKRVETILSHVKSSNFVKQRWNGQHLLILGSSHGASAPVFALSGAKAESFKSSGRSGMCMFDGVYNSVALDKYFWQHRDDRNCEAMRERLICQRYLGKTSCAFPADLSKLQTDTLTQGEVSKFPVKDFALIECGSLLNNRCGVLGDLLPSSTIRNLCDQINASNGGRCTWLPMPLATHAGCAVKDTGIPKCMNWFDNLAKQ